MALAAMAIIKITLETLYDILRNEKKREDLQKLGEAFFLDVIFYLREKKALLEIKHNDTDLFAAGEKDKLEYELRSIKRIVKEIYEKREKKIIDIALNRSRTGSDIIDTSAMLREEREFYDQILNILDQYRKGVLLNIFQGQLPATAPTPFSKFESAGPLVEEGSPDPEKGTAPVLSSASVLSSSTNHPFAANLPASTSTPLEKPLMTKIRFIHPVPSFVWKDLKVYGPFDPGETTEIYPEVAELLVRKGRAEKL